METSPSHAGDVSHHTRSSKSLHSVIWPRHKIFSSPNNQENPRGLEPPPAQGTEIPLQQAAAPGPAFVNSRDDIKYVAGSPGPVWVGWAMRSSHTCQDRPARPCSAAPGKATSSLQSQRFICCEQQEAIFSILQRKDDMYHVASPT